IWKEEKEKHRIEKTDIKNYNGEIWLGIDSGSTTTKIVAIDKNERVLYSYYTPNNGNPIEAVKKG
ncbi:MAG TPA: hypothetical protein DD434_08780, partial [Bacteroidales bacterium]|nr:hypothetical protein [Bacteroidales bacterium]